MSQPIPLSSAINTDSAELTSVAEEPQFNKKTQIFWNGTLRNTQAKKDVGLPLTSGKTLRWEAWSKDDKKGVQLLTEEGKKIPMPFTSVLADYKKSYDKASGDQIAHAHWNGRLFTLYRDQQKMHTIVETDEDDNEVASKQLDFDTAMITSVYKLDEQPVLFTNKKTRYSTTNFDNYVEAYNLIDWFDFKSEPAYKKILDSAKLPAVDSAKDKMDKARETADEAYYAWQLAYNAWIEYPTEANRAKEQELESKRNLTEQQCEEAANAYYEALYSYNPSIEVEDLKKQIEAEQYENKETETKYSTENASLESARESIATLQEAVTTLNENVDTLAKNIDNMKAPKLDADSEEKYAKILAEVDEAEGLLGSKEADLISKAKVVLDAIKNTNFNWSWRESVYNGTVFRGYAYWTANINGKTVANYLVPNTNKSTYINFAQQLAQKITLTIPKSQNGVSHWRTGGASSGAYSIPDSTFGTTGPLYSYSITTFNWNYTLLPGYSDMVFAVSAYATALEAYNQAQASYVEQMTSDPKLNEYYLFIQSYNSAVEDLVKYKKQRDEYTAKLSVAEAEYADSSKLLDYYKAFWDESTKRLAALKRKLIEAEAEWDALPEKALLNPDGSPQYTKLDPIFTWKSKDGVPLGEAHSGTVLRDNSIKTIIIGFEDDDKNRARTLWWDETTSLVHEVKWFGTIGVRGDITGEPIPDPDIFKTRTRQSNGTYRWDMRDAKLQYLDGQLIGGYSFKNNALEKIVIDTWTKNQSLRVNISANDTLTAEEKKAEKPDPIIYFVTNFADSRGMYYDYGPGWIKTYVRKIHRTSTVIYDCYMYTFGMVSANNLRYQKESVMAKGKTKEWPFTRDKLNKRIYTCGGTNKADDSMLSRFPFSVDVLKEETDQTTKGAIPTLRMQMYGLVPISFSYNKSLVTNGEDHSATWQLQVSQDGNDMWLHTLSMSYNIKKTSEAKHFKMWKVADYYFSTNILSDYNVVVEDRQGNINIARGAIPYEGECVLDIEDLNLTAPAADQLVTNDTWYWMAAYDPFFTKGVNASYLVPSVTVPLYIDNAQLDQFQNEALEQRGSILKPMLKGLFDEYEGVDVFYTMSTVTTTLYYKTTHVVKISDIGEDQYDIYGKETYDVSMANTTYSVSSSTQFFPLAIGSIINNINYITPTIELEQEYAVRLYTNANRLYGGYQYANRIYNGTNIFTIYGRNYYYDRQGVYFIGTASTYTSNQFVCYALGMKYLANSGSEAYFYSQFDKTMYVFTGSNTVQKMVSLSNKGYIVDSLFSSQEQMLYLLTDEGELIMRREDDSACIEGMPEGSHLEGTELGCAVVGKDSYEIFSPFKKSEKMSALPFTLETQYLGSDASLTKMAYVDYLLYNVGEKTVTVDVKVHTLAGIEEKVEEHTVEIKPNMWKGRTYRLRYSPRNNVGNAFKVGIYSDDEIAVSSHLWEAGPYGNGSAPRNTVSAR